jgi:4-hydroxy-tetrahydrodipicolinate synthase
MTLFKGSGVAIITPFNEDMSINFDKLGELIEFQIDNKTDAIIICGTTGEASTLTDDEQISAIEYTVKKVAGRIPVIAGAGSNHTAHGVELSKRCEEVGVDGILSVTPYYNKASKSGLIAHFTAIADAVNVPIILYNVPGRTGVNMPASVVYELSQHKNIVGIKEASGDIGLAIEIAALCGEDFAIYSGNDDLITPLLSIGGQGVISVLANVLPKETHDMVMSFLEGDTETSRVLQVSHKEFIDALFIEPNPIPVKAALNLLGKEVGPMRLPLTPMAKDNEAILAEAMKKLNLL